MELVYAVAAGLIFLFLIEMLSSRGKKPDNDPELTSIIEFIDSTLQGYPDRFRQNLRGSFDWTCHTRLFTIHIQLIQRGGRYRLSASFFRDLPFTFRAKRALIGQNVQVESRKGAATKKLIAEKEISPLLHKLHFYDSINVNRYGMTGVRTFGKVEELDEWHKTLGSSIRFMRFLLNYKDRKDATSSTDAVCPYCKGGVDPTDHVVSCLDCRTLHHEDCWAETNRCSVFGCGSKSEVSYSEFTEGRAE